LSSLIQLKDNGEAWFETSIAEKLSCKEILIYSQLDISQCLEV